MPKRFTSPDSHAMLAFSHQTLWQHSGRVLHNFTNRHHYYQKINKNLQTISQITVIIRLVLLLSSLESYFMEKMYLLRNLERAVTWIF